MGLFGDFKENIRNNLTTVIPNLGKIHLSFQGPQSIENV